VWKHSKHDDILPILNFVDGVQAEDSNKMKRETKSKADIQKTTLTTFSNG